MYLIYIEIHIFPELWFVTGTGDNICHFLIYFFQFYIQNILQAYSHVFFRQKNRTFLNQVLKITFGISVEKNRSVKFIPGYPLVLCGSLL